MGCTVQKGRISDTVKTFPKEEQFLRDRDSLLADVIDSSTERWPSKAVEPPIWGLLRIIMAQQISTASAARLAERVAIAHPGLLQPKPSASITFATLRKLGLPQRRAECCLEIVRHSETILTQVHKGHTWEQTLAHVKGIGPWTIATFRIMVLRDPDVLPVGDVGLARAIARLYGPGRSIELLAENWRPYRSVACWYLWRTLGNVQLG
jgi:DNA-3-methyladenine glycosylase II